VTGPLVRVALRRERVFLPVWLAALVLGVLGTASSFSNLYASAASRRSLVSGLGDTPATLALYGRIYSDTVGGLVAWRLGGIALVLVALLNVLIVVRHTRADEESGRAELVLSAPVDRRAPLVAALLVAAAADAVLAVVVLLGLLALGLGAAGSTALVLALALGGFAFAGVAALTAQVTSSARGATGLAGAALGVAYVLRALGDAGPHWMSWLSPLGWCQQVRAFDSQRLWPLALVAAFAAAGVVAAWRIAAARDVGSGLLPDRPGPARGAPSLRGPLALAWRLQRGPLAAWAVSFALLGAAAGSVAESIQRVIGDSPGVGKLLRELGGEKGVVDAYLAGTLQIVAILAALYAVQATLRLRSEETAGRAEPVLATPVSRVRWALGHAGIAAAGCALILAAAGLAAGGLHAVQTGEPSQVSRLLAAALVQLPAALVPAGLALALFGLAPRASAASWGFLALCLLLGQLGPVLHLDAWLTDLSPFSHVPRLPGGELSRGPLWMAVVAAALGTAGLAGLRRRDLT
jgi:ABC-2 type transport system permease protein